MKYVKALLCILFLCAIVSCKKAEKIEPGKKDVPKVEAEKAPAAEKVEKADAEEPVEKE